MTMINCQIIQTTPKGTEPTLRGLCALRAFRMLGDSSRGRQKNKATIIGFWWTTTNTVQSVQETLRNILWSHSTNRPTCSRLDWSFGFFPSQDFFLGWINTVAHRVLRACFEHLLLMLRTGFWKPKLIHFCRKFIVPFPIPSSLRFSITNFAHFSFLWTWLANPGLARILFIGTFVRIRTFSHGGCQGLSPKSVAPGCTQS